MCSTCKTTTSTMWRKGGQGEVLCNSCGLKQSSDGKDGGGGGDGPTIPTTAAQPTTAPRQVHVSNGSLSSSAVVRKSSRLKPGRGRPSASGKSVSTKGKSRRIIFKKNVSIT